MTDSSPEVVVGDADLADPHHVAACERSLRTAAPQRRDLASFSSADCRLGNQARVPRL